MLVSGAAMLEAMVDVVLVVDVEGSIVQVNRAAVELSGYSATELQALPIATLLDDEHSGVRTQVRRRIVDGQELHRNDSWLIDRAGTRIPVSVVGSPVFEEGALRGIVLVVRDNREVRQLLVERDAAVDELRRANATIEDKLEHMRRQLLLAERRSTLGTLAGGVGHELRNIAQVQVAAIDLLAQALDGSASLAGTVRAVRRDLERVTDHMLIHANRLLVLARPGPDHLQPIAIGGVIREVVTMLRGAGRLRGIEVEIELPTEPAFVTVNRTRIEQILVNLIINSVDAITAPGTIAITVRPDDATKRMTITVRDSGAGMPPEVLARILEPFFTTKSEDRGTGLGLPVVVDLVENYGGKLLIDSVVGTGTTVTFDLPMTLPT
jgi:PAS domain S-box-containing protein